MEIESLLLISIIYILAANNEKINSIFNLFPSNIYGCAHKVGQFKSIDVWYNIKSVNAL